MKRDAPLGQKPPAAARDARSLRAQLSRAVGDALRAVRSTKTALPSKQRLSDVLWNDRTLLASAAATARVEPEQTAEPAVEPPTARRSDVVRANPEPGEPSDAVEVVSDGEVEAWFEAALEEPADLPADPVADAEAAAAFGDALESAAAEAQRARHDVNADFDALLSETTNPVMVSAALLAAATPEGAPAEPVVAVPAPRSTATDTAAKVPSSASEPVPGLLVNPEPVADRTPATTPSPAPDAPPVRAAPALAPAAVAPTPAVRPRAPDPDQDEPDEEPILTRSMARLLAGQGHRQRALKILDALLEKNPEDAALRAEADALRQAVG